MGEDTYAGALRAPRAGSPDCVSVFALIYVEFSNYFFHFLTIPRRNPAETLPPTPQPRRNLAESPPKPHEQKKDFLSIQTVDYKFCWSIEHFKIEFLHFRHQTSINFVLKFDKATLSYLL